MQLNAALYNFCPVKPETRQTIPFHLIARLLLTWLQADQADPPHGRNYKSSQITPVMEAVWIPLLIVLNPDYGELSKCEEFHLTSMLMKLLVAVVLAFYANALSPISIKGAKLFDGQGKQFFLRGLKNRVNRYFLRF